MPSRALNSDDALINLVRTLSREQRDRFYHSVTSVLLSAPRSWRERRLDTFTPIDESHYRQRTTIQFCINDAIFGPALNAARGSIASITPRTKSPLGRIDELLSLPSLHGQRVRIVIPLVTLPKRLLMKVDVEGATGRLPMLNRFNDSAITAHHLNGYYESASLQAATATGVTQRAAFTTEYPLQRIFGIAHALAFRMPSPVSSSESIAEDGESMRSDDRYVDWLLRAGVPQRDIDSSDVRLNVPAIESAAEELAALIKEKVELAQLFSDTTDLEDPASEFFVLGPRNPILNPLELAPDFVQLMKWAAGPPYWLAVQKLIDEGESSARVFVAMVHAWQRILGAIVAHGGTPATSLLERLLLYSSSWVACVPVDVRIGESQILKLTHMLSAQTSTPVRGTLDRLRETGALSFGQIYPFAHGDAVSNHAEVEVPDPSTIEIHGAKVEVIHQGRPVVSGEPTEAQKGSILSDYGILDVHSKERISFYTNMSEKDMSERLSRDIGERLPFAARAVVTTVKVVYRPLYRQRTLLGLLTLFSAAVAIILLYSSPPLVSGSCRGALDDSARALVRALKGSSSSDDVRPLARLLSGTGGLATAAIAAVGLIVGVLGVRDRASIVARCYRTIRAILAICLAVAIAYLIFKLVRAC